MSLIFVAALFSACSSVTPQCSPAGADVVYVVSHGWHAELGIPVEELDDKMGFYRDVFPGARTLMIGYGKKTFLTAPADDFSEYILGPIPGPAAIQAVGLTVMPDEAYDPEDVVALALPPGGKEALSAFIWNDLVKDASGKPLAIAPSTNPDGMFYDAESGYTLLHTCNTWTAQALQEAGLPVSADNVIFSGQVMARVEDAAEAECRLVR